MKKVIIIVTLSILALLGFILPQNKAIQALIFNKKIDITVREGTNIAVSLSPDKQTLAIDLQGRLWLMPVDGGKAWAITDKFGDIRQPHWSPDGEKLCFQGYWDGNWHIYTIEKDGSNIQQLTDGIYDHRAPQWSPDGQQLVFSSDRNGTYDIWTIDINTQQMNSITESPGNEYAPTWNNDGNRIAFVSDAPDQKGIYYYSFPKNIIVPVLSSEKNLSGLSWQPSGDKLLFVKTDFDESNLMQINLGEANPISITHNEDVFPFRASWLSDDTYIYTADGRIRKRKIGVLEKNIIPFSATFSVERAIYSKKKYDYDHQTPIKIKGITHPILAPNGKDIAYIALNDVHIQKENGQIIPVTNDEAAKLTPSWSPDGDRLAYISDVEGSWNVFSYELATKKTIKIGVAFGTPSGIAWSPDGAYIAFSSNFGPRLGQLWIMSVATGKKQQVGRAITSSIGCPTWSPDSRRIGITTLEPYSSLYREGINRLLLFNLDSNKMEKWDGLKNWSFGVRAKDGPVWSPNGKQFAAINNGVLWAIPVDDYGQPKAPPVRLTNHLADIPSWSGDSKSILFLSNEGLQKIHLPTGDIQHIDIPLQYKKHIPNKNKLTAIHVKGLFDGNIESIQEDMDILVKGNRIVGVEPHKEGRAADKKIDTSNAYALPGLIDIHAHQGSWAGGRLGKTWLAWGITATRDPATDPYDALNRREATETGLMIGPRIYFTGSPIDGNRIYYAGSYAFQSPAQLELELERAATLEYDFIKTYVRLPDLLQRNVVERAHQLGIPITSHELYPAVAYGVDGIEHIAGTSRRGYSPKLTATLSSYEDVTNLIAQSGMSFTPTIGIYVSYNYLLEKNPTILEDQRLQLLESSFNIQNAKKGIELVKSDSIGWTNRFQNACQMIKDIHDKQGLISAGTDSPILPFGFGLHLELEAYQAAGLSPFEVLQTATINNAKVLGTIDDMGTIEVGKLADFIIVEKNPLEDIKNIRAITHTIMNGNVYTQEALLN